jgi:hypothetical protein
MAENKKSFILYCDIIHTLEKLSDDDAGKLFKHILRYVNDLNPTTDHLITQVAFEPIKQQLKRDLVKFQNKITKLSENGKKGAEKRWKAKDGKSQSENGKSHNEDGKKWQTMAVNDNVNDNVIVNDINKRKEIFKEKLNAYANEYGKRLIYDFFLYWSEHGDNDRKMRFEKEKTFGVKARLNTWKNRAKGDYDNPNKKFKSAWS